MRSARGVQTDAGGGGDFIMQSRCSSQTAKVKQSYTRKVSRKRRRCAVSGEHNNDAKRGRVETKLREEEEGGESSSFKLFQSPATGLAQCGEGDEFAILGYSDDEENGGCGRMLPQCLSSAFYWFPGRDPRRSESVSLMSSGPMMEMPRLLRC